MQSILIYNLHPVFFEEFGIFLNLILKRRVLTAEF